jgi:hypothetical protein
VMRVVPRSVGRVRYKLTAYTPLSPWICDCNILSGEL